jgi:hypothetical protein
MENAIHRGALQHLQDMAYTAAITDLTAEFRRLCRLEGEYKQFRIHKKFEAAHGA